MSGSPTPGSTPNCVISPRKTSMLLIHFEPRQAPEIDIDISLPSEDHHKAPAILIGAMNEQYGPFDDEKWFEVFGDLLEHLGQAFTKLGEGENPAVVERRVMGDEESDYNLTVTKQ